MRIEPEPLPGIHLLLTETSSGRAGSKWKVKTSLRTVKSLLTLCFFNPELCLGLASLNPKQCGLRREVGWVEEGPFGEF